MQFTFREPLDAVTVLRNRTRLVPWRSIAIDTSSSRAACCASSRSLLAACNSGSSSPPADQIAQPVQFVVAEFIARQQHGHRIGDRAVVFLVFRQTVRNRGNGSIQQAQTGFRNGFPSPAVLAAVAKAARPVRVQLTVRWPYIHGRRIGIYTR